MLSHVEIILHYKNMTSISNLNIMMHNYMKGMQLLISLNYTMYRV